MPRGWHWAPARAAFRPFAVLVSQDSQTPWLVDDIPAPRRPIRLPEILSREEVERLIQYAASPLHRIWLLILYATGIRRQELVQLKIEDIDSDRMLIRIRQGKGKKDRNVMLSPRLLQELRDYWRSANPKPTTYLFPSKGAHPNADNTERSGADGDRGARCRRRKTGPHTQAGVGR